MYSDYNSYIRITAFCLPVEIEPVRARSAMDGKKVSRPLGMEHDMRRSNQKSSVYRII